MNRASAGLTRRELIAGATASGVALTAGCLDRLVGGSDSSPRELSLSVKSVPSDEDPQAAEIARRFTENLAEVGVDVSFLPRSSPQLTQDVFFEQDFDVFVERSPLIDAPSVLIPLLHSANADLQGIWLNPFGFESDEIDSLLETAHVESEDDESSTLASVQELIAGEYVPFTVIGLPDELTAVDATLPATLRPAGLATANDVLPLARQETDAPPELNVGLMNGQLITDLNPLRGRHTLQEMLTNLLFDPLLRFDNNTSQGWISDGIIWQLEDDPMRAEISIREDLLWHDGVVVDAADVAFTYDFLTDLSGDEHDSRIPAGQHAGKTGQIASIEILDQSTLRFTFEDVPRLAARRALTVPILPEHHWSDRIGMGDDGLPLALAEPLFDPIGSGPYQVSDIDEQDQLLLERFDAHVANDESTPLPRPGLDRIHFSVPTRPPNVGAAVNLIADGELHLLAHVPTDATRPIALNDRVELQGRTGRQYYLIGFNTDREACADPALRRLFGRMVDRTFVAASVFGPFGTATESPLAGTPWSAETLEWSGQSVLGSFPGAGGYLDIEAARSLFAEVGFPYDVEEDAIVFGE